MNRQAKQYVRTLGLYQLPAIEQYYMEQTSGEYELTTFKNFFNRVAGSRIFHIKTDPDGKKSPYYHKPMQYLSAAMTMAGYNKWDVGNTVEKLRQTCKDNFTGRSNYSSR